MTVSTVPDTGPATVNDAVDAVLRLFVTNKPEHPKSRTFSGVAERHGEVSAVEVRRIYHDVRHQLIIADCVDSAGNAVAWSAGRQSCHAVPTQAGYVLIAPGKVLSLDT